MNQVKLTITITAIISAIVLIAQNCFGIILFVDTDPGTIAGAIVTVIVSAFGAWKAIAEYVANVKAKAAEQRNTDLEKEIVGLKAQVQLAESRFQKLLLGQRE